MKVKFEVDSEQIGMPQPGVLLIQLGPNDVIETKRSTGWVRVAGTDWLDIWNRYRWKKELVQIGK